MPQIESLGRPMRIAIVNETYSNKMGYAEHCLSKALASLGVELHLITAGLPHYYTIEDFKDTYGDFNIGHDGQQESEIVDGYTVHYIGHSKLLGRGRLKGLSSKLRQVRPDIVQTFASISWVPLDSAMMKLLFGYKLFTGNHTTASVFPLAQREASIWDRERIKTLLMRGVPGRAISLLSERCYAATADCADVAVRFFGVLKSKIDVCPLGVDTDVFYPLDRGSEREETRARLGFRAEDIVCVYSGRFAGDKNPLLLARAVERLVLEGEPYRALFIGNGGQAKEIAGRAGSQLHSFIPYQELGSLFRACDIGVWPAQESTSMLDAAACGLPIIVNDTLVATERIDGNGITYRLNDIDDLVRALRSLRSPGRRKELGTVGASRMATLFSWKAIAERRLQDYRAALGIAGWRRG
jgi:glycosyltransferase involved in cell wall biosynthesis